MDRGGGGRPLLLGGCSLVGGSPEREPDADPTTLTSYDAKEAAVVRGPFCDRVSPTGVEHALGAVPADGERVGERRPGAAARRQPRPGARVRLPVDRRGRVGRDGVPLRAAGDALAGRSLADGPPVGAGARRFAAQGFGRPNVAHPLRRRRTPPRELTYRGLFGDAWVVCSLRTPGDPASLPTRASAWCVEVLEAARLGSSPVRSATTGGPLERARRPYDVGDVRRPATQLRRVALARSTSTNPSLSASHPGGTATVARCRSSALDAGAGGRSCWSKVPRAAAVRGRLSGGVPAGAPTCRLRL